MLVRKDYATSGLTIQQALLSELKRAGKPSKDLAVQWGRDLVRTFAWCTVPAVGRVRIKLLKYPKSTRAAVDLKIEKGGFVLEDGTTVSILRTWADEKYEDELLYEYLSETAEVCITVANERFGSDGEIVVDRLIDNSGFLVRNTSHGDVYCASASFLNPPDFSYFEFSVEFE